jgi:hypothetical protein
VYVYLLQIYAAEPRLGSAAAGDRAPGIVSARSRQIQLVAAADDRPLPRPCVSALPPSCAAVARVPHPVGVVPGGDGRDPAVRPTPPGGSRSPPIV